MAKKGKGKVVNLGGQQNPQQQPQLKLDPRKLETVSCPECGGIFFDEVTMYKEVPAVQSPNGVASMLPIPVVLCNNCGTVHPKFTPKELIDGDNQEG
jgi:uncharacterized Zn finger protein|tara:strand:- start:3105 stop:3395 length:291 start_codon:yes stop_codon:yes gene_type:complete